MSWPTKKGASTAVQAQAVKEAAYRTETGPARGELYLLLAVCDLNRINTAQPISALTICSEDRRRDFL